MPAPKDAAATQLANIIKATGLTLAKFTAAVKKSGLAKHGQIVAFLKSDHGLTHGNANLIAHKVREALAGGPAAGGDLLAAQYSGKKAALRPIYDKVEKIALALGKDVQKVIQKTGVAFRRKKNFLVVHAASAKRVQLGLNLDETPEGERCVPTKGMCNHKASLFEVKDVDKAVKAWIKAAYQRAG